MTKKENTLIPYLSMLKLDGKPYTLENYEPLEPIFNLDFPMTRTVKAGRQLGKSVSICAQGALLCALRDYFAILYALPLHAQAKEISQQKLQPLIENSPYFYEKYMTGAFARDTWQFKRFSNNSKIYVEYTLKNPMRAEGKSADFINFDEVQDYTRNDIPRIKECLSGSEIDLTQATGVPKTKTNYLQERWNLSSQAEWGVHCRHCDNWNIPSMEEDLLNMIGKKGPICAKCGKRVRPEATENHWIHGFPKRRNKHAGYHIPQIIIPLHSKFPHKWQKLLDDKETYPENQFLNEKLGEAADVGRKRITEADIKAVCQLPPLTYKNAVKRRSDYHEAVLTIDPGGKGEDQISTTAIAVLGKKKGKLKFDLLWGKAFGVSTSSEMELATVAKAYNDLKCDKIAYDFRADPVWEWVLKKQDIRKYDLIPMAYSFHPNKDLMIHNKDKQPKREYYSIDKTRSLLLMMEAIKRKKIFFPKYESFQHLARHILALEDDVSSYRGSEVLRIAPEAGQADDFADCLNMGVCYFLYRHKAFDRFLNMVPDLKNLISDPDLI